MVWDDVDAIGVAKWDQEVFFTAGLFTVRLSPLAQGQDKPMTTREAKVTMCGFPSDKSYAGFWFGATILHRLSRVLYCSAVFQKLGPNNTEYS